MDKIDSNYLNLEGAWSISEKAFRSIIDLIRTELGEPRFLVEFGSGTSSIRLALEFPQTQILSIENHLESFRNTEELARKHLKRSNLQVQLRQLRFEDYGGRPILSYEKASFPSNQCIDCVIIDGPPFFTIRGREACLYQVWHQIKIGGVIILDDFSRRDEKQIVKNWMNIFPGCLELQIMKAGHHLAFLKKLKDDPPMWDNAIKQADVNKVQQEYELIKLGLIHIDPNFFAQLPFQFSILREAHIVLNSMQSAYSVSQSDNSGNIKPTRINRLRGLTAVLRVMLKGL